MASNMDNATPKHAHRRRRAVWGTAGALLLLPAIAMRFPASGVDWDARDFLIMGALLSIACGAYELAARRSGSTAYRAAAGLAIVTGFLTVWVNLAVGMLGSERNPANLLFGGVLAIAVIGTLVARLRPSGLSRAMLAAALAQMAMALYALFGGYAEVTPHVALFAVPWLLSAWLFSRAGREQVV